MPRLIRSAFATAALLAVAALSGGAPAQAHHEVKPEVIASGTSFSPPVLEVHPGTEVIWKVEGDQGHNVTLDDPEADCDPDDGDDCEDKNSSDTVVGPGLSFKRKFETIGEYGYYCAIHGGAPGGVGMSGKIRVTDPNAPTTEPTATTATTAPPTTTPTTAPPAPVVTTRPPAPAPTPPPTQQPVTTKPPKASAATKPPKTPKPASTTAPPPPPTTAETTTTTAMTAPPLGALPPLIQVPAETTTTARRAPLGGEASGDGFVALNERSPRGGAKKLAVAAVGTLGISLLAGGAVWWRRRPSRYWSA